MKTIAIYNNKGGIAKTTTAVNFAYNLTCLGYRALVVDMDPQGNASSFFQKYDLSKPSVKELLTGSNAPARCIKRTKYKGLDIIPSNINLRYLRPDELAGGTDTLRRMGAVYGSRYDYCVIDCPPSVDFLIEVIMAAADDVIIPIKPDCFSLDGLSTVQDVIQEFGCGRLSGRCLVTQFYQNKNSVAIISRVVDEQAAAVYDNVIRRDSAVDRSLTAHKPLTRCASRARAAQDYMDFTKEYLEQEAG
ncbi:MAG: AAA family ATPase [Lachnospiraceae bacterium]|jgi:chromosome partitioning protein|nr:AAA family ATPase [Lachnospiraceae bacterium]